MLMAGRAIEEMLGETPAKVREHAKDDTLAVKRILKIAGVPHALMDSFMDEATARAKDILKANWDAVKHTTAQAVKHYGGEEIDAKTLQKYRSGGMYEK
jgi:hypothetical protein